MLRTWRGLAVIAKPYPVSRGGQLGWEIQQEEMAACARVLSSGAGLMVLQPAAGGQQQGQQQQQPSGQRPGRLVSCPDYDFFISRSFRSR